MPRFFAAIGAGVGGGSAPTTVENNCPTCDHAVPFTIDDQTFYQCRRFPPVLVNNGVADMPEEVWQFPVLPAGGWCGEHSETGGIL